jgi:hypothetical protein
LRAVSGYVVLAAVPALKLPELIGPEGNGIRGQARRSARCGFGFVPLGSLLFGLVCSIYFAVT